MFSPDPNQLACAQVDGVFVVNIRKPKRFVIFFVIVNWKQLRLFWTITWFIFFYFFFFSFLYHLSSDQRACNVRHCFDGSRLLCSSEECEAVYDLGTNKKLKGADRVSLPLPSSTLISRFAGKEGELLVSAEGNDLFIWQLPPSVGRGERIFDSPLLVLSGHQNPIMSFCFSKNIGVLASGDCNGAIKLWVPNEGN